MKTLSVKDIDHKRLRLISAKSGNSIKDLITLAVDALKEKQLVS